ncbi:MAG: WYL domain-containing transcriptional regulator [Bacteroidia bacterium]
MAEADYKGKLLRLFREIMLLAKSPFGLSINDLVDKLGVTYRTIYRDLELLEQVGFFPEEISKGKYVIRGLDSEVQKFEKNLQFSAEEAGILAQALASIPETNPMKKVIAEKMLAFSGMEDVLKVIVKTDISRNMEKLATAIRERRQVRLHNYHSANSSSIKSRRVEPFAFSADGVFVKGFEHGQNVNKTYKIERIEEVALLDERWQFEVFHEVEAKPDIFGINGGDPIQFKLRLSMRAAHLLKEEYPLSASHIYKEDYKHYLFEGSCNSFIAIGRFVLGLLDEIEVLEPAEFKDYLTERIGSRKL